MSKKSFSKTSTDVLLGRSQRPQTEGKTHRASQIVAGGMDDPKKSPALRNTERKGRNVTIYLNAQNYDRIKAYASSEKVSASSIIDNLIAQFLQERI